MRKNEADHSPRRHLCQQLCQARCCRYITVHVPAPRRQLDFDELSWFLAHDNISLYFNRRHWHLEVRTPCAHLTSDNLCAIYHTRPLICRGHDANDCEYPIDLEHDLRFTTKEQFDAWWESNKDRARRLRRERRNPAGASAQR